MYENYGDWSERVAPLDRLKKTRTDKDVMAAIAWELGVMSFKKVVFERAQSIEELSDTVHSLLNKDYRVMLDVAIPNRREAIHTVGILATGDLDTFQLASNWLPSELGGGIRLEDLRPYLNFEYAEPDSPNYTSSNITALPPSV